MYSVCLCAGKGSTAAGKWGDYQCDVPYRTLESLMEFIAGMKDEVIIYAVQKLKVPVKNSFKTLPGGNEGQTHTQYQSTHFFSTWKVNKPPISIKPA